MSGVMGSDAVLNVKPPSHDPNSDATCQQTSSLLDSNA